MPVAMRTVNVNAPKKRENNTIRTGAQIGAAIGIGKLGIDTIKAAYRIHKATGNGLFKQIGLKLDEIATAKEVDYELKALIMDRTTKNLINRTELIFMLGNANDMFEKPNIEALLKKAKELGIDAQAIHKSKTTKFLSCTAGLGKIALINAGIGCLIGAGIGKIIEIFSNKKEAEKQEIIEQVKTESENQ